MKRYIILFAVLFAFNSCGDQAKDTAAETNETTTPTETQEPMAQTGEIDPVCEMEKDNTWTEFTVHESDTVWFCSETCKAAFEGNPAKYMNKAKG